MNKKILVGTLLSLFISSGFSQVTWGDGADPDALIKDESGAHVPPSTSVGNAFMAGNTVADDSIITPTFEKTSIIKASLDINANRACGQMNPFDFNSFSATIESQITEKIDAIKSQIASIPSALMSGAIEYAWAKVNPTLYQLTQLNIDEYMDIFQLNVKKCEEIQQIVKNNPDASPFDLIMKNAIAEEWLEQIGDGSVTQTRDLSQKIVSDTAKKGVVLADGERYGGQGQEEINLGKSMLEAGANILLGRPNVSDWKVDGDSLEQADRAGKVQTPMVQNFSTAEDLVEFVEDVYGSETVKLDEGGDSRTSTRAGVGYQRAYSELRNSYTMELRKYMDDPSYRQNFFNATKIMIPPAEIEEYRHMEKYEREVYISNVAKQEAIKAMKRKLSLAKSALKAGNKAPNLVDSPASEASDKRYKELLFSILDDLSELEQESIR